MERMLYEYGHGESWDPTRQYDWALGGVFETETVPHEICMSTHVVPNVRGPLRSEMMIIAGVIGARMRRRRFQDFEIFPVSLSRTSAAFWQILTTISHRSYCCQSSGEMPGSSKHICAPMSCGSKFVVANFSTLATTPQPKEIYSSGGYSVSLSQRDNPRQMEKSNPRAQPAKRPRN